MANCTNCSAPLPKTSTICIYCNSRNDVDLDEINHYTTAKPGSKRICPNCDTPMQTINLKTQGKFYIERCEQCMGLFFDIGELEALLEQSVSNVFHVDTKRIDSINRDLFQHNTTRATYYIKCPVCRIMMNRKNFSTKSGVITDVCSEHGVWLEGGELKRLMEWRKAGGQLLHDKVVEDSVATREKQQNNAKKTTTVFLDMIKDESYAQKHLNRDSISSIFELIGKLF